MGQPDSLLQYILPVRYRMGQRMVVPANICSLRRRYLRNHHVIQACKGFRSGHRIRIWSFILKYHFHFDPGLWQLRICRTTVISAKQNGHTSCGRFFDCNFYSVIPSLPRDSLSPCKYFLPFPITQGQVQMCCLQPGQQRKRQE